MHGARMALQLSGNALADITTTDDEDSWTSKTRWQSAMWELVYRQNRASPLRAAHPCQRIFACRLKRGARPQAVQAHGVALDTFGKAATYQVWCERV